MTKALAVIESLNRIHILVQQGNINSAQRSLRSLLTGRVLRKNFVELASLARRAGMANLGIRLLNPIVRPAPKKPCLATAAERAEYAASLISIGAADEALTILKAIREEKYALTLLYKAFALFTQWDYATSIPILSKFSQTPELSEYDRCVGQVNLAAALVMQKQYTQASPLLLQLREETKNRGFKRLYGNCLELSAQCAIFGSQWAEADRFLNEAQRALTNAGGLDSLFVKKWATIGSALRHRTKENLGSLQLVREEALKLQHWETVRDCDLFLGVIAEDESKLIHVYYGTPHENYRRRIFLEYKRELKIPDHYSWYLFKSPAKHPFDMEAGQDDKGRARLPCGGVCHHLFAILASDFYRPFRLASLHAQLYPGEFFNPVNSPLRVHQLLKRLRQWFAETKIPLQVFEENLTYRLFATGPVSLRIPKSYNVFDRNVLPFQKLQRVFGETDFTVPEAAKVLQLPRRTTLRILQKGQNDRIWSRIGAGPSTRYRTSK